MTVDRSRLPEIGPDVGFHLPRPTKSALAGAPMVWSVEHHEVPVVAMLLMLPAGSAQDPPDRPGLAALTADLLDEGAGELDALALHDALARYGARLETECTPDATFIGLLTLTRHAAPAMRLLADVVFRPLLAPSDFERVRTLRRNRLAQMKDLPGATADRLLLARLYGSHPYGHLPIGTEAAIEAVQLDEVREFHARVFDPSRATLIVVGDVTHEAAVDLARQVFAPLGRGPGVPVPPPPAVPRVAAAGPGPVAFVARDNAPQSELRVARVGVARSTPDYHALVVANAVLGGQFTSRINLNLREDKGVTYGARSYFDFRRLEGPFVIQASVQTNATGPALREIFAELDALGGARPVTPRELELARQGLTRGYARNFETTEQIARAMAQVALHELPDDYFDHFVDGIRAVEAQDVTAVARRYFVSETMDRIVVGDPRHAAASLDAEAIPWELVDSGAGARGGGQPRADAPGPARHRDLQSLAGGGTV